MTGRRMWSEPSGSLCLFSLRGLTLFNVFSGRLLPGILQAHYLAEAEVIESAYKGPVKKYHPDVNRSRNSPEMLQMINQAYETFGDPVRRRRYGLEREIP